METLEQAEQCAADLHWLATLLTGRREIATDVTMQALTPADDPNTFFSTWMQQWSRRIVIAKALAAVREDLARSAHRTGLMRGEDSVLPPASWTLQESTTKADLERALLAIEVFPRAAVLLLIFERVPLPDTAILLDSEPALVRIALAGGVRGLTINLARIQGWTSAENNSVNGEVQNA